MNKKASLELILSSTIQIFLSVILIVGAIYVLAQLVDTAFGSKEAQITTTNVEGLNNALNQILTDKSEYKVEQNYPFYIEPGYVIIGFGKTLGANKGDTTCLNDIVFSKPLGDCGDSACLCLYKYTPREDEPVNKALNYNLVTAGCTVYPDIEEFQTMDSASKALSQQGKRNTAVYGVCLPEELDKEMSVTNLYIEKYTQSDKKYLMLILNK
ncbi:MAG: hypothetical protein WC471_00610 [Candidatus Woesearchaeota archaeon]